MTNIAEQIVADALGTCGVDHNKAFFKAASRSALNRQLVSILDDTSGISESFEDAIIQVTTALKLLAIIA